MTAITSEPDPGAGAIMRERRQLINLAYRLLGSLAEAEDAVQEAYARWYALSRPEQDAIRSPGAWLTTVTSRICLDLLGSARSRRERYVGAWIPEPLPEPSEWVAGSPGATADPADRVALDESVTMAFLVVLDAMTPAERVAFVLHEVYRYSFPEIAEIVGRTPAACRQLATSARRRVRASQADAPAPAAQQAALVRDFKKAWDVQDIDALIGLLDPDAIAIADGGGRADTVLRPIEGSDQVARYAVKIAGRVPAMTMLERTVNGRPGLVAHAYGAVVAVIAFDVADGRITRLWAIRNPDKLRAWGATA